MKKLTKNQNAIVAAVIIAIVVAIIVIIIATVIGNQCKHENVVWTKKPDTCKISSLTTLNIGTCVDCGEHIEFRHTDGHVWTKYEGSAYPEFKGYYYCPYCKRVTDEPLSDTEWDPGFNIFWEHPEMPYDWYKN